MEIAANPKNYKIKQRWRQASMASLDSTFLSRFLLQFGFKFTLYITELIEQSIQYNHSQIKAGHLRKNPRTPPRNTSSDHLRAGKGYRPLLAASNQAIRS